MQMAHIAREPCNYFLLLRALFRSIGGGLNYTLCLYVTPALYRKPRATLSRVSTIVVKFVARLVVV